MIGAPGCTQSPIAVSDGSEVEEAGAEIAPDLVPGADLAAGLGRERLGVEADRNRVGVGS